MELSGEAVWRYTRLGISWEVKARTNALIRTDIEVRATSMLYLCMGGKHESQGFLSYI